jgi:outer membrane immunogenic protein
MENDVRNRLFAGAALVVLVVGNAAQAADLGRPVYPVYKAPVVVPAFSWTGCYIGADAGGAWDRQNTSVNTSVNQAPASGDITRSSVIGGPYVGCNYQFAPQWVIGVEGDVSWVKLSGATSAPNLFADGTPVGVGGISWGSSTDWIASARARLGYAVAPNALIYGTGGAAWTRTNYSGLDVLDDGVAATSFTDTRTGWVAGAGVDWAPWNNNWIFRIEYLHYQFGGVSSTAPFVNPNLGNVATFNFGDLKIDSVRAGLSYKF